MVERNLTRPLVLTVLLLLSSMSPFLAPIELPALEPSPNHSASASHLTTFSTGASSIEMHPSLNESSSFSHMPDMRVSDVALNLSISPTKTWDNRSIPMSALGPISTLDETVVAANGQLELNGSGGAAPVYSAAGTFLSPIIGQVGTLHLSANLTLASVQPVNTSIEGAFRHTVDSTNWFGWQPLNIQGQMLPPFAEIQFQLNLSTTDNTTTPTVGSISYSQFTWRALDDASLDIGNVSGTNEFWSFDAPLGLVRSGGALAGMGPTMILLSVPVGAKPAADAWVHIMPPGFLRDTDVTISMGSNVLKVLNSSDFPDAGLSVPIPSMLLSSVWPTSSSGPNGTGGIPWEDISISCATGFPFMGSFGVSLVALPYILTTDIGANGSMLSALNQHVNLTSNSWLEAVFNDFPLLSDGSGDADLAFTLQDLNVTYIDDIIPQVIEAIFLVDGQEITETRTGALVEIRVHVLAAEDDLALDWHLEGLGTISSWPPASLDSMAWDAVEEAYIGWLNTSQFPPTFGERMALWLWVNDTAGNSFSPVGVGDYYADFILRPEIPAMATGELTGCEQVSGSTCAVRPGDTIQFEATSTSSRSDLDVFVHLLRGGTEDKVVPLHWNDSSQSYRGDLPLYFSDIGSWDASWRALDVGRGEGGFSIQAITHVRVYDNHSAAESSFSTTTLSPDSTVLDLNATWTHLGYETGESHVEITGPAGFSELVDLVDGNHSESVVIDSYVALGSGAVVGDGAGQANSSSTSLIHQALQEAWPEVQLTNLGHGWATVHTFDSDLVQIRAANPDVVTILPIDDYASTSASTWRSNYPALLDELGTMGAEVFIGALMLDPDYLCHIESGPGGCHRFGEFESAREKNQILIELASTRPWVTIVPMSDDGPLHDDWLNNGDDYTDAGHAALAEAFLHSIEGRLSLRTILQDASLSVDISEWAFGEYQFELTVTDAQERDAEDLAPGPDTTFSLVPPHDVLSIQIITTAPETLYPGDFEIAFDAVCTIGCEMILEVELDGERVEMFNPGQGLDSLMLTDIAEGQHHLGLKLWTQDWPLAAQWATLDFEVKPAPAPIWSVECSSRATESVIRGVTQDGELGNLTTATHSIDCSVANTGNAAGTIRISSDSAIDPLICNAISQDVEAGRSTAFNCAMEESGQVTGTHEFFLVFEQVGPHVNVGTWDATFNLSAPRFQADLTAADAGANSSQAGAESLLTWVISFLILLVVGLALISILPGIRERMKGEGFEAHVLREDQFDAIVREQAETSDAGEDE